VHLCVVCQQIPGSGVEIPVSKEDLNSYFIRQWENIEDSIQKNIMVKESRIQKLKARIAKLVAEYISQVNIDKMVSLVYLSLNAIRV